MRCAAFGCGEISQKPFHRTQFVAHSYLGADFYALIKAGPTVLDMDTQKLEPSQIPAAYPAQIELELPIGVNPYETAAAAKSDRSHLIDYAFTHLARLLRARIPELPQTPRDMWAIAQLDAHTARPVRRRADLARGAGGIEMDTIAGHESLFGCCECSVRHFGMSCSRESLDPVSSIIRSRQVEFQHLDAHAEKDTRYCVVT